jgi:hypothetical protein
MKKQIFLCAMLCFCASSVFGASKDDKSDFE